MILDGAMGTMIQEHSLDENDFRGKSFVDYKKPLKGNNDLLNITMPDLIKSIHRDYLEAGADIIETNTFNSTSLSLADYGMEKYAYDFNYAGAKIAKEVKDEFVITQKILRYLLPVQLDQQIEQQVYLQMLMILDTELYHLTI